MTVPVDATRAFEGVVPESSGGSHDALDAMNTGHAAVTWLSTVGIGSIRVRRFARGWRPCNGGWDEVGRR
jgi:hypothetical protein